MAEIEAQKREYRIVDASFKTSVFNLASLPAVELPEAAFIGRSNVGKSSLLNSLCDRKALARTSKTPGRTQSLNYYLVNFSLESSGHDEAKKGGMYFVDLPGYGYAQASKGQKSKWPVMIERYILNRENLAALVLLVDCRREPQEEEKWLADAGRDGELYVALTKADKLPRGQQKAAQTKIAKVLNLPRERIILTSSAKGKQGIAELRHALLSYA